MGNANRGLNLTTATTIAKLENPRGARAGSERQAPHEATQLGYTSFLKAHLGQFRTEVMTSSHGHVYPTSLRVGSYSARTRLGNLPMRQGRGVRYRFPEGLTFRLAALRSHLRREQLGRPIDPPVRYIDKRFRAALELLQNYNQRIDQLRVYGQEDGITLNEESERAFWTFIESSGFTRRAGLALMDNGNLRAVWKGDDGDHLGVHFLGNHVVNYVIFKRRPGTVQVSRVAGNDTFDGIKKQVRSFALNSLVNV